MVMFVVWCAYILSVVTALSPFCPIDNKDDVRRGNETGTIMRLYECTGQKEAYFRPRNQICGEMVKETEIARDVEVDIGYDKNGFSMKSIFVGNPLSERVWDGSTCFSWRKSVIDRDGVERSSTCETLCKFAEILYITYKEITRCSFEEGCSVLEYSIKVVLDPQGTAKNELENCYLYGGNSGDVVADKIWIDVDKCNQKAHRKESCDRIKTNVFLQRGQIINMNQDVNNHPFMVKFYGSYLCTALRQYNRVTKSYRCSVMCYNVFESDDEESLGIEYAEYDRTMKCASEGVCVGYPNRYFIITAKNDTSSKENDGLVIKPSLISAIIVFMASVAVLKIVI
eukprot:TCONS_00013004-protein